VTCRKLLILDDDPAVGETIAMAARAAGFEAEITTESSAFFEKVESWSPTHIALDLVMPGMDGIEVVRQLAQRGCEAALILTSGVGRRTLEAAERSVREHGLCLAGTLPKPFRARALNELLNGSAKAPAPAAKPADIPADSDSGPNEAELAAAIEGRTLRLAFQPKVAARSGSAAGFEVLVRWPHPRLGLLPPCDFIGLAERSDLIDGLTRLVAELAFEWFGTLPARRNLTLSLNLSARSLNDLAFADWLAERCEAMSVLPDSVILELTETSAMTDQTQALDLMLRLRMKGFHLSIDDFGTGYSSMVQLARLPFTEIKVDKSFVMTTSGSAESRTIVRSIVELGHALGLRVVAEGVEDEGTVAYLRTLGCDLLQGFGIARPMWGEDAVTWLAANRSDGGDAGLPGYAAGESSAVRSARASASRR